MESVTRGAQPLRERVLSVVMLWFAIGGCLYGAVVAVHAWSRGEAGLYFWIAVLGGPTFAVIKILQSRLGYRLSACLLLAHLLVLNTLVESFRSLTPGTALGHAALLVLSGVFFGARGVSWTFAVSMGTFGLAAWLALHGGALTPWDESYWNPHEPLVWLRYAFILAFFGGGLCAALALMIGGLERSESRLCETLERERVERRQREEVQAALEKAKRLEGLGQLAAGVAHDFNNNLMVIMGGASVVRSEPSATPAVVAQADEILDRARAGARTVQQLLSLGSTNGVDARPVTLDGVLRRNLPTLKQALSERVQLELSCTSQSVVRVDVERLQQALLNLATNARDAMPDGGRWTLRVAEHQLERVPAGWEAQPGPFVALECIDTGVGVNGETIGRLFEPFFSTKGWGKGTGLGLVLVRKAIVEAGGFIEVESAPGAGTTFRLFFPVQAEHELRPTSGACC